MSSDKPKKSKILVLKNLDLDLEDKKINDIIKKEICVLFDSKFRMKYKPKHYLIKFINNVKRYKLFHYTFCRFMSVEKFKTIIDKLGIESYFKYTNKNYNNIYVYNLYDYESLCDSCGGTGWIQTYNKKNNWIEGIPCEQCYNGILNWIEKLRNS